MGSGAMHYNPPLSRRFPSPPTLQISFPGRRVKQTDAHMHLWRQLEEAAPKYCTSDSGPCLHATFASRRTSTAEHENIPDHPIHIPKTPAAVYAHQHAKPTHSPRLARARATIATYTAAPAPQPVSRTTRVRGVHRARIRLRLAPPSSPTVSPTKKKLEKETPTRKNDSENTQTRLT
ncbi:hypothetical protein B0H16DRAFT_670473 [Mycena metata]|uniref:Uncharacterized protein n=1 Tax=Mycena metata TaxID=1033252 RepID=A0AAD7GY63_9AGAR|nr:hypothetical protein B0H16DRAFT_670473 [Mycena metata]